MYLKHLVEWLAQWEECDISILSPDWALLPFGAPAPRFQDLRLPGIPRQRVGRVIYEQTKYAHAIHRQNLDVFLALNGAIPLTLKVRSLVLVKALQCFFTPAAYGLMRRVYLQTILRLAARQADILATPTAAAAEDLRQVLGTPKEKIRVIPEALYSLVEDPFEESSGDSPDAALLNITRGRPFLLNVGATYAYKNLDRLVRAFALCKHEWHFPHVLLLVGGEQEVPFSSIARWAIHEHVGDDVIFARKLTASQVRTSYHMADAFVMPTLYETFGHPVLEAMAHGCPVVTSNRGSVAEIAGGAAELVDVTEVGSIASGIYRVLTDGAHRAKLISAGRSRASEFTWDRTIGKMKEVIKELVR